VSSIQILKKGFKRGRIDMYNRRGRGVITLEGKTLRGHNEYPPNHPLSLLPFLYGGY